MRNIVYRVVFAIILAWAVPLMSACGGGSSMRSIGSGAMEDTTITARVKTALLNDQQINATKIDVVTTNGVVTISGTVGSEAEARRAVELTRQTAGVKEVKSALQVGS
jgi:hyperosmotically inducible protein